MRQLFLAFLLIGFLLFMAGSSFAVPRTVLIELQTSVT